MICFFFYSQSMKFAIFINPIEENPDLCLLDNIGIFYEVDLQNE